MKKLGILRVAALGLLIGTSVARADDITFAVVGPMTGQHGHFSVYAPEAIPYAQERYRREARRLLRVLDTHLRGREFIAGDYGIADMACHPWIDPYDKAPLDLEPFAEVRRWHAAIAARPAVQRAYALSKAVNRDAGTPLSDAMAAMRKANAPCHRPSAAGGVIRCRYSMTIANSATDMLLGDVTWTVKLYPDSDGRVAQATVSREVRGT